MLHAIDMFDVDWMKNTNVGLIKINYSDAGDVLEDLRKMLATNQGEIESGGVLALDTIERLNSILVITRQYAYLQRVHNFVRKLDVPAQGAGSKLYVYPVKYSTAEELAALLGNLFGSDDESGDVSDREENLTGPGSVPETLSPANPEQSATGRNLQERWQPGRIRAEQEAKPVATGEEDGSEAESEPESEMDIKIVAAPDSNALLIFATPGQYAKIELALEKLDIPPLQVLMEVTIMDVKLVDEFSYGMQWFLENGDATAIIGSPLNFAQTFSYASVRSSGDVRALLGLLAADGKVDVLSSPSILVRNNRKASIRVGDQQPISTSALNENGTIIATSVTYRDTGILLEIRPSITSGGVVNVELTQEVVDVGDIDAATGQRTFLNRNLHTTVSVTNGETIVLGGLIRTNSAVSKSGVPGLRDIPGIGFMFGKTVTSDVRTELLMIMSPRIIRNSVENNEVIKEYKSKFKHLTLE